MTDRFEAILDESISALQAGVPIEEILAEVPDYAGELRPLLFAANLLTEPDPAPAPVEKKEALRTHYLDRAAQELSPTSPTWPEKIQAVSRVVRKRLTWEVVLNDLITVGITIILTLVMSALLLNYAARDAIPGDFLYGVKRIGENVRLSLTFDQEQQLMLEDRFNQARIAEINQLIAQNRVAAVQFQGVLDTKGENLWVIEGLTVFIPDDVSMTQDDPQEGDVVKIIGLLRTNNVLIADVVTKPESRP